MGGNRPSPVLQLFPLGKTMSRVEARIGTGREQGQVTAFQLATGCSPLARRHLSVLQPCAQQPGYLAASSSRKLATLLPLWDRGNGLSPHPTPQPNRKESLHQWEGERREIVGEGLGFILFISVSPGPCIKKMLKICSFEQLIIARTLSPIYFRQNISFL